MPKIKRIIIDAMGGDNAPLEILKGTFLAVKEYGIKPVLVGNEEVIKKCIEEEINVVPIPGACAMINSLICSGLNTKEFTFLGFLPLNKKLRKNKLEEIKNSNKTIIIYEAPHKLETTLKDLKEILNNRKIVLAREITKIHEEFVRENIDDLIEKSKNIKGEIVLIIEENDNISNENKLNDLSIEEHYKYYEDKGYEKKEIIKLIAKDRNVNKNEIYKLTRWF